MNHKKPVFCSKSLRSEPLFDKDFVHYVLEIKDVSNIHQSGKIEYRYSVKVYAVYRQNFLYFCFLESYNILLSAVLCTKKPIDFILPIKRLSRTYSETVDLLLRLTCDIEGEALYNPFYKICRKIKFNKLTTNL